ncbi:hypothetical protein KKB83_04160 [Patescibacteria group bacterium]|nr:hypothetical protein [Patescibacteria group bacterium]
MASKRNYLTIAELEEFADITVIDDDEAEDQISQAEELIDAYVGFQDKAIEVEYRGMATGGSTTSLTLQTKHQNLFQKDYFKYCMVEIIGGIGQGERKMCLSSTLAGVLTTEEFSVSLDSTSYYRIFQLGKFPRLEDAHFDSENVPNTWYKFIPEKLKRAVACQVEYKINMGDSFFSTNKANIQSESIGDYSYSKSGTGNRINDLIAPKAKMLLNGIRNIVGEIEV